MCVQGLVYVCLFFGGLGDAKESWHHYHRHIFCCPYVSLCLFFFSLSPVAPVCRHHLRLDLLTASNKQLRFLMSSSIYIVFIVYLFIYRSSAVLSVYLMWYRVVIIVLPGPLLVIIMFHYHYHVKAISRLLRHVV